MIYINVDVQVLSFMLIVVLLHVCTFCICYVSGLYILYLLRFWSFVVLFLISYHVILGSFDSWLPFMIIMYIYICVYIIPECEVWRLQVWTQCETTHMIYWERGLILCIYPDDIFQSKENGGLLYFLRFFFLSVSLWFPLTSSTKII
jgi:hypothetical protein